MSAIYHAYPELTIVAVIFLILNLALVLESPRVREAIVYWFSYPARAIRRRRVRAHLDACLARRGL